MKFSAHDIVNDKPIDLYKIFLSKTGEPIAFESLDGELYGRHQVHMCVDITILTNETVFNKGADKAFSVGNELILGSTEKWTGIQSAQGAEVFEKVLTDEEIKELNK